MLRGREALEAALRSGPKGKRRHKYGVSPPEERTVDGFLFASKAEAVRWRELELLRKAGAVRFVLRQVPFHLPGRVRYVLDFLVFWSDGRYTFEDVKGHATALYKVKRRQVAALFGIEIEEPTARPRRPSRSGTRAGSRPLAAK